MNATLPFRRRLTPAALISTLFLVFTPFLATAQRPLGVDVSSYQGSSIDWVSAKNSGISFAWAKATEGLTVNDSSFSANIVNAPAAGVVIGAYHYAHPELHIGTAGADQEAAHFWSVVSNYVANTGYYLMPMLDIEQDLSAANPPYTKTTLSQWVNEWCKDIVNYAAVNGVVVTPVVYTYVSYSSTWLDNTVTVWPLWMAQYPSNPNPQTGAPSSTAPWASTNWMAWQYSSTGTVPGIPGACDLDVYNGTAAGLTNIVIGTNSQLPVVALTPRLDRAVDAGGSVNFAGTATGTAPLHYQWLFNNSPIPGATSNAVTVGNAQTSNSGNYALVATNLSGSVTSAVVRLLVYPAQATVFSDTFDTNSAANWTVNKSSGDTAANFNFDYSTLGIPSAPHSTGGTTLGLQLKANLTLGVCAALSVSPTGQSFSGDYRVHFDGWINVNGPFPGGGASSTEFLTAGIGTAGNRTEWTTNATADGYYFSVDGDGGVSASSTTFGDYSGYIGKNWQNAASGIYAASSVDNGNTYYTSAFPTGQSAPALQQANYPQQTGALNNGTFGLAWHDVIVSHRGGTVDWVIDGIRIATISNATFTASNVFVGFWDPFASLTDNTNLSFGLVDNLRVEVPAVAPAITNQPQSQTSLLGANVLLNVGATGLPAPAYQWIMNSTNIPGATNSTFAIGSFTAANAGTYSVLITNVAGSVISSNAVLALQPPDAAQFQSIAVLPDSSLQIVFTGDTVWTYTVETSTNLTDWSVLTNLTSSNGTFTFIAGHTTNDPVRFYRARVGP